MKISKNIYQEAYCAINVNNYLTDWFKTESDVKQGDTLSPTLFNVFFNDLVSNVKELDKGVKYGNEKLSYYMLMILSLLVKTLTICNICSVVFLTGAKRILLGSTPKNLILYISVSLLRRKLSMNSF